ncbi:hypothetical protein WT60_24950 [Burkholderia sp. MSMB617WGS]|nr:hypothetical protein WT60_24950 [Burkholderia sp. MSMB617WGS]
MAVAHGRPARCFEPLVAASGSKHARSTLEARSKHARSTLEARSKHARSTLEARSKHARSTQARWPLYPPPILSGNTNRGA